MHFYRFFLLVASFGVSAAFFVSKEAPRVSVRSSSESSFARDMGRRVSSLSQRDWPLHMSTVEAPTRPDTERKTSRKSPGDGFIDDDEEDDDYGDLEYAIDPNESREMEDPFHILLMGSTFEKPKITVSYVSGSLEYVLGMPVEEATELSKFAKDEGFSCLGTWPREECLQFGKQLQRRDIVCRVVPFAEGGQRGWQAKDAKDAAGSSSSSSS